MDKKTTEFKRLLDIMDSLREKCPWDKKQTYESLRKLTLEEVYELADAVVKNDINALKNELGDLLLHIVFYAKIGSEKAHFDIGDVLAGINKKLINRHPHVYGDIKVADDEEVKKNWEHIKLKEGNKTVLSGIPVSLPALIKAQRMQEKARGVGFDWEKKEQVWDKVKEELDELQKEINKPDNDSGIESEFGDLFFALVNAARLYGIDPEIALERTNLKFIKRFNYLEAETITKGKLLHDMTLAEMDEIWERAKELE
ncbi:MAG: nucleoside triphosphate pyrophosphohydrolase [Bacteroidia bacterium]|nr:nucleoside triphosphate pyrophosphohydrolase [Bacteroidia bacterium]